MAGHDCVLSTSHKKEKKKRNDESPFEEKIFNLQTLELCRSKNVKYFFKVNFAGMKETSLNDSNVLPSYSLL